MRSSLGAAVVLVALLAAACGNQDPDVATGGVSSEPAEAAQNEPPTGGVSSEPAEAAQNEPPIGDAAGDPDQPEVIPTHPLYPTVGTGEPVDILSQNSPFADFDVESFATNSSRAETPLGKLCWGIVEVMRITTISALSMLGELVRDAAAESRRQVPDWATQMPTFRNLGLSVEDAVSSLDRAQSMVSEAAGMKLELGEEVALFAAVLADDLERYISHIVVLDSGNFEVHKDGWLHDIGSTRGYAEFVDAVARSDDCVAFGE